MLRRKLADFGFESNDDYDFPLRCLFEAELSHLRVLHVDGHAGRRKTAFANALAQALEFPHVLYHDFGRAPLPAPPLLAVVSDEGGAADPPMNAFDRAVTEACAYSEADRTILILDQLQAADFADQVRLYRLASTFEWTVGAATVTAHRRNLLMVLASSLTAFPALASRTAGLAARRGAAASDPGTGACADEARWRRGDVRRVQPVERGAAHRDHRGSAASGSMRSTSVSTIDCCATTRPSRRRCA
jgi:hypothetical protein